MKAEKYYEVGSIEDIVISNSSMSHINPEQGGSPLKFKDFFTERKEVKSLALLRGSIFHAWAENPKSFHIAEIDKPTEKLGFVADALLDIYKQSDEERRKVIKLEEGLELNPELQQLLHDGCRAVGYYNNYKFDALIKSASSVIPYLQEVVKAENEGKWFLTRGQKENLEKCVFSLKANKLANELLFYKDDFSDKEYLKEQEYYWSEIIEGVEYKFKMKLDDLEINHENKTVTEIDIKTTSKSAYVFKESFIEYHYGRQHFFYRRGILANRPELATYKFKFKNIAVETNNLFQTVIHAWHPSIIDKYEKEFDDCFLRIRRAIANKFTQSIEEENGLGEIKYLTI